MNQLAFKEIRKLYIKINKLYLGFLFFVLNFNSVFAYTIKQGSSSFDFFDIIGLAISAGIIGWIFLWIGRELDIKFFEQIGGFLFRSGFGTIAGFVTLLIVGVFLSFIGVI